MNYLKQALTELLSGLTTKKNEKEIWTTDEYGLSITIEPIDDENYIMRRYYRSGGLHGENYFKNDKRHGDCKRWHEDGRLYYEGIWENGNVIKKIK